jgi:hypothetical protein
VTDKPKLTPANENPWYVLMTLHGEQDGVKVDDDLHDQNRAVWNAWSCQQLDDDAAAELAKEMGVDVAETRGWAQIATEVKSKHRAEMKTRNDDDFTYPGFPDFESPIQCSEIQFCNILVLKGCIFTQPANFSSATFTQTADFSSATFDGPAKFVAARFGVRDTTEICVPIFTEAAFARLVSFRDADFVTHYPVLEGMEFRETVVVTAKSTHWPSAGQPLLDQAAKVLRKVPTKEVAKDSCARLRHALGKQGMPEEEHFFFTREMHHAGQIGSWFQRLPYRLFGWVSGYGGSIERPALGLIWLFLAPLGVYLAALGPTSLATFGKAMALSFASIFIFLGFQRTYFGMDGFQNVDIIVQMLTATQTVLSFILLFFLGLGLRTRFRLR